MRIIDIYASPDLGAFGFHDKPWYLPDVRLKAFVNVLHDRGLGERVNFCTAPAATDTELCSFHTAEYVRRVRGQCETNQGSVDNIHPRVVEDAMTLCRAIEAAPGAVADLAHQHEATFTPSMSLETYLGYLGKEGLLTHDADTDFATITDAGRAWLANPHRRLNGPTFARAQVERAATFIAGAAIHATRRILAGDHQTVFIPIAGFHHAHPNEARLYCLYNDPALAITTALQMINGNVAYIDVDVHHGDGVHKQFADNDRVFLADLHEDWSTLFPFSPEAPGPPSATPESATVCTVKLPPNTSDQAYLTHWERVEAFVRTAKPAFIVFEAGVDALAGDPTSHQALTLDAIRKVARRVRSLADEYAHGRLLVLGGGGYDPESVANAWVGVLEELLC
jgi:acetoin utilization protein AcuC